MASSFVDLCCGTKYILCSGAAGVAKTTIGLPKLAMLLCFNDELRLAYVAPYYHAIKSAFVKLGKISQNGSMLERIIVSVASKDGFIKAGLFQHVGVIPAYGVTDNPKDRSLRGKRDDRLMLANSAESRQNPHSQAGPDPPIRGRGRANAGKPPPTGASRWRPGEHGGGGR